MLGLHWLLRMSRWARNPPSARRVVLVLAVIAVCFAIYLLDHYGAWPDWAKIDHGRGRTRTLFR